MLCLAGVIQKKYIPVKCIKKGIMSFCLDLIWDLAPSCGTVQYLSNLCPFIPEMRVISEGAERWMDGWAMLATICIKFCLGILYHVLY